MCIKISVSFFSLSTILQKMINNFFFFFFYQIQTVNGKNPSRHVLQNSRHVLQNSCLEIFQETFETFQNICSSKHRQHLFLVKISKATHVRCFVITHSSVTCGLKAPPLSLLLNFRCSIYVFAKQEYLTVLVLFTTAEKFCFQRT